MKDPTDNTLLIKKITLLGLVVNIVLSAIKFITGIMGSSTAIIADAVHSLSDMSTDIAVLLGVRYWTTPADEDHPYGHQRIETLITAAIGVFLGMVAVGIGYHGIISLGHVDEHSPSKVALIGALVSMIIKELLYHGTVRAGKKAKSSALIANAWHHRSDAISSIPAFAAVAIAMINPDLTFIDHVGAIIVSLFILQAAWKITRPALNQLTVQAASIDERSRIMEIIQTAPEVQSVHALRTRRMGSGLFIDLHLLVDADISVRKGHEIAEKVKGQLLENGPDIADVVVHVEPFEKPTG